MVTPEYSLELNREIPLTMNYGLSEKELFVNVVVAVLQQMVSSTLENKSIATQHDEPSQSCFLLFSNSSNASSSASCTETNTRLR